MSNQPTNPPRLPSTCWPLAQAFAPGDLPPTHGRWRLRWPPRKPRPGARMRAGLRLRVGREHGVQAAIKAVPLGQTGGQRILARLLQSHSAAVDSAIALPDHQRQAFNPMLAILSAQHRNAVFAAVPFLMHRPVAPDCSPRPRLRPLGATGPPFSQRWHRITRQTSRRNHTNKPASMFNKETTHARPHPAR